MKELIKYMRIEPGNCTSYDIVYGQYLDQYNEISCIITWLGARGGPKSFTWSYGAGIHSDYVSEKSGISQADLAGIFAGLLRRSFDSSKEDNRGCVGELMGFEEFCPLTGRWVG